MSQSLKAKLNALKMGSRIKDVRLKIGDSQAEWAEYLDVSPSFLSHIESATRPVPLHIIVCLSTRISDAQLLYIIKGGNLNGSNQLGQV